MPPQSFNPMQQAQQQALLAQQQAQQQALLAQQQMQRQSIIAHQMHSRRHAAAQRPHASGQVTSLGPGPGYFPRLVLRFAFLVGLAVAIGYVLHHATPLRIGGATLHLSSVNSSDLIVAAVAVWLLSATWTLLRARS